MSWTKQSIAAALLWTSWGACASDSPGTAPSLARQNLSLERAAGPVVAARVPFKSADTLDFDMDVAIGVVPAHGTCAPENASWRGGAMFGKSDVRSILGHKFCLYRRTSNVGSASALPPYCPTGTCDVVRTKLAPAPASAWLEPTPHALLRQGSPDAARRVASAVKAQLRSELRGVAQFPRGAPPPVLSPGNAAAAGATAALSAAGLPARAVVHVVDDLRDHGNAVATMISQLACPAPAFPTLDECSVEVRRHDAFDVEPGGAIERGSAARLAQLLVEIADSAGTTPTVVNLSLGFHPEAVWAVPPANGTPGVLQIGHLALQAAINYARCQGVIVISAAGNRDGGGADGDVGHDGFMFPAAWHTTNGWTCGSATPSSVNEPLLYAASGVRGDGRPIASARPRSEGLLVAPAFVTTVNASTGEGRLFWEGSSFATAAISATAVRVRSYMPFEANGLAIMRMLWSSGLGMPDQRSSSGLGYASGEVRRVRMCSSVRSALGAACSNAGYSFACSMQTALTCTEPASQTWPSALSADRAALNGELAGALAALWQRESQGPLPSANVCGPSYVLGTPDVWSIETSSRVAVPGGVWNPPNPRNAYSCPFETLGNGQSDSLEIGHQPGSTGCHGCVVYRTASNQLVFSGSFAAGWVDISSSPALRTRGIASNVYPAAADRLATARVAAAAAAEDELLYELGDALGAFAQPFAFELTGAAPESLNEVELVLEYTVEHGQASYAIAQTIPVIDLL